MKLILSISVICCVCLITSCASVKGFEKAQLNDPDMELADKKCHKYVTTFQAYREAAVGANGGKTGGGCGCN